MTQARLFRDSTSSSRRRCSNSWKSVVVKAFAFGLGWLLFSSSSSSSSSPLMPLMPLSLQMHPVVAFIDCFVMVRPMTRKRTMQRNNIETSRAKNNIRLDQTGPSGSDDEQRGRSNSNDNDNNDQPSWLSLNLDQANSLEIRLDATLVSIYVLARFLVYDIASGAKDLPGLEIQDWVRILSAVSSAIILSGCWTLSGIIVTQSFQIQQEEEDEQEELKTMIASDNNVRMIILTLINTSISVPLWFLLERAFHFGPPGFDLKDYTSIEVLLSTGLGLACTIVVAKTATKGWK